MSYPRPTNPVPDWDPPDADVVEPLAGEKATGWQQNDIPEAEVFNWWWRGGSRWLRHLRDVAARYLSLYDAGQDGSGPTPGLTAGSTFVVYEDDGQFAPGSQIGGGITVVTPSGIAVTDQHIITAHAGGFLRAIGVESGVIVDIGLPGAGATGQVRSDGALTAIARGNDVHLYDSSDPDPNNWSFVATLAHGAIVHDVAMDGTNVYLVGGAGTGTHYARAFTRGGVPVWDYDHQAILYHCCTDGVYLFVGGAASGAASGATLRALDCVDGSDATNEGGTSANTTIGCWNSTTSTFPTTSGGGLVCTRKRLFSVDGAFLQVRSKGADVIDTSHPVTGRDALAVDQDFVYGTSGGSVYGFDHGGVRCWTRNYTGGNITQLGSSGTRVYLARSAANDILRAARGNRPGFWVKGPGPYTTPRAELTPFRSK